MRRRNLIIAALFLVVAGVGFAWVKDTYFFEPGVTEANFRRLHNGMEEGEIEAILGRPSEQWIVVGNRPGKRWVGKDCVVEIDLRPLSIHVLGKEATNHTGGGYCKLNDGTQIDLAPFPDPFLDKLRRCVGF